MGTNLGESPEVLESYLAGRWQRGEGVETELVDPVHGNVLATASASGLDLKAALDHARTRGGAALRALSYAERAKLVGAVADVLIANRAKYEEIAIANSGNTKIDAAIDIDGGIGTLKYYARLGAQLGDAKFLLDEKAGAARQGGEFSGDPSADAAAWRRRAHQCVQLSELGPVGEGGGIAAGRRAGARQAGIVDGDADARDGARCDRRQGAAGGRAQSAVRRRRRSARSCDRRRCDRLHRLVRHGGAHPRHPNVLARGVLVNVEADSVNAALLAPDAAPGQPAFDAFVKEVGREMTVKAGQKCTAIRRIFVPAERADAVADALLGAAEEDDARRSAPRAMCAWGRW